MTISCQLYRGIVRTAGNEIVEYGIGIFHSPITILATLVLIVSTLTATGLLLDSSYDIPNLIDLRIILPILGLTAVLKWIHYSRMIKENNIIMKRVLVLVIVYVVLNLQFMALAAGMLDFIFTTAKDSSHLSITTEAEEQAFWQRSVMILVYTLVVFPALERFVILGMQYRNKLAGKLITILSRWFGY